MAEISSSALVVVGRELLSYAEQTRIPYVSGGMTLSGMDCQGLDEYLLIKCGLPRATVDLAGSNAHWRNSLKWVGSIEEAVKLFGSLPGGSWPFIWESGYNSKYKDNEGDASHMGLFLGETDVVHSAYSKQQVCRSELKTKSINGGWNRLGLVKWVQYSDEVEAKIGSNSGSSGNILTDVISAIFTPATTTVTLPTYAHVYTEDGNPVKLRNEASVKSTLWWKVPNGAYVPILGQSSDGNWYRCTYGGRTGYIMKAFLV